MFKYYIVIQYYSRKIYWFYKVWTGNLSLKISYSRTISNVVTIHKPRSY